jgi:hypothetical protein
MKAIIFIIIAFFVWSNFFGEESGCEKYSSKYACNYVEKKATYEVYYWINVSDGDEKDNKYVGSTVGLQNCRDMAIGYSNAVKDRWSERSYICALMKDGSRMEKHRY